MKIHVVDGTYELFRHFFAVPPALDAAGREIGAVRGVVTSIVGLLESGATHAGVATDHVIESFRNRLYPGYKTGDGIPEPLWAQFPLLEDALRAMGVMVWPMVEFEADDALAAAAARAAMDERVEQVLICTPDKDLAQCVAGKKIVQWDRRRDIVRDEDGVVAKWGVKPASIPDWLAVVGDTADGYPGLPGWGAKAAELTFSRYPHLEDVPKDWRQWGSGIRAAQRLCAVLQEQWEDALLYRTLATLRLDVPVFESIDAMEWKGPEAEFESLCRGMQAEGLYKRAMAVASR
ncbi:MAG: flap endonuclease [Acidobacteria bacterium]|nr:flap endonuclease [Acidobacteriota bacterium]